MTGVPPVGGLIPGVALVLALAVSGCDAAPGWPGAEGEHAAPAAGGESSAQAAEPAESGARLSGDRGPEVTVRHHRYRVEGTTGRELHESLLRRGREMEGEIAPGWTEWSVDVGYSFERSGERCRLTRPDVDLRATVHLPRWSPPVGAEGETVVRWNRYVEGIRQHEAEHVRIARRAAEDVFAALDSVGPGPCPTLRSRVDLLADSILTEARHRQDRYDRETDHGRVGDGPTLFP